MSERGRRGEQTLLGVWLSFLLVAAVGVIADQLTKWAVFDRLVVGPGDGVEIIRSFLAISPRRNTGGVFGVLQGHSPLFGTLAVISLVVVAWLSRTWLRHSSGLAVRISLSAVLAGAVGNLIDRAWFGHVRDFIDIHVGPYSWPTFNLADTFITVGAIALALSMVIGQSGDKQEEKA